MMVTPEEKNLSEPKTRLKNKYPVLTDSDLLITNNNKESMLTTIAYNLRKSNEEMSRIVDEL